MEKLYDRIIWHNGTTPAINETNLNKMSKALDDIDDRIIQIAGAVLVTVPQLQAMLEHTEDIMEQIEELSQNPPYIGANGNWYVWDTSTGEYVDSGVDASITVTIDDVTALAPDAQPYVTNTGTSTDPVFHLFIPRGQPGKGISSIAKTGTSGYVDTYTITYTDNTSTTYTVTNGRNTDQVTTIPTASAALVGTIYQYIGASTSSYTHGFYYECVNDGGIYKWVNIPVGNDPVEITSSDPYTFRQGLGTMADMDIVGGTVAWNQMVQNGDFASASRWIPSSANVSFSVNNNIATVSAPSAGDNYVEQQISMLVGHKYLLAGYGKTDSTSGNERLLAVYFGGSSDNKSFNASGNNWTNIATIFSCVSNVYNLLRLQVRSANINNNYKQINLFDLTQMFGSTIADYIYSLEQATAGAGVAWFRKYFPKDYYAYDAGSIQSVCIGSRKVVTGNLLDESTLAVRDVNSNNRVTYEPFKIFAGTYTISKQSGNSTLYVKDYSTMNNITTMSGLSATFTVNEDTTIYITSGVSSLSNYTNINVMLEKSAYATNYKPYSPLIYPFDSTKELRGLFSLVGDELKASGDIYTADGSVERKYGIVDLGTLNWEQHATYTNCFYAQVSSLGFKTPTSQGYAGVCNKYQVVTGIPLTIDVISNTSKAMFVSPITWSTVNPYIIVNDNSYASASDFTTAMSGVYLVYELATPTTESAKPYQNPQRAFSDGTEGFTMTGIVPVGNNTTYQLSKALIPAEDYTDGAIRVVQRDVDGKAVKDMISDAWVSGQAYSVRDYCIYGDTIYRCIQTVTQGTAILPTNTSYWTPVKIAAEIKSAKSDSNFALLGIAALEESLTPSYHYNTDALSFLFQSYDSSIFPSVTNDDCVIVYGNIVLIHLSVGGDLATNYMIGKIKDSMRPPFRGSTVYTAEVDTTMVITPLSGTAFDYSVVHVRIASNGDMIMSPFSTLKNNATGTFTLMYIKS